MNKYIYPRPTAAIADAILTLMIIACAGRERAASATTIGDMRYEMRIKH